MDGSGTHLLKFITSAIDRMFGNIITLESNRTDQIFKCFERRASNCLIQKLKELQSIFM